MGAGQPGASGKAGVSITRAEVVGDKLLIQLSNESAARQYDVRGAQGRGIKSVSLNSNDQLVMTMDDNTILPLVGPIRGPQGPTGITQFAALSPSQQTEVGRILFRDNQSNFVSGVSNNLASNSDFTGVTANLITPELKKDPSFIQSVKGEQGTGINNVTYDPPTGNLRLTLTNNVQQGPFMVRGSNGYDRAHWYLKKR